MNSEKENSKSRYKLSKWQIFWIIFTCLFVAFFPLIATFPFGYKSFEHTEDYASTIGGITAPVVGLIGAFLVYRALRAQIAANDEIIKQFEKQQIKDDEQKRITIRQNFESAFFQMLSIHHDIVSKVEINFEDIFLTFSDDIPEDNQKITRLLFEESSRDDYMLKDRSVFKRSSEFLIHLIHLADQPKNHLFYQDPDRLLSIDYVTINYKGELFQTSYETFYIAMYEMLDTHLGHYFRNLYRIIKMIDEQDFLENSEKTKEIKYYYTSIVRAQLSDYEIHWLFFNGIGPYGEEFKSLIEKYTLLKILNHNPEEIIVKLKEQYKESAFVKRK